MKQETEAENDNRLVHGQYEASSIIEDQSQTCMMNRGVGFDALYAFGLSPSRMPIPADGVGVSVAVPAAMAVETTVARTVVMPAAGRSRQCPRMTGSLASIEGVLFPRLVTASVNQNDRKI